MTSHNPRKADHAVSPQFLERWSPRAFTGDAIPDAILMRIFEAARWAPSASNLQPWIFLYAKRGGPDFDKFHALLAEGNRPWVKNAAAIVFLVSRKTRQAADGAHVPSRSHSLDAGAAWAYLALEASAVGWPAHGMIGVDFDHARDELHVPDDCHIEMAIAIGKRGDRTSLPEKLQGIEAPNARKPVSEIVIAGPFPKR
ncbi:MAG TPA: nitroreductase family protein [Rhodoblastus sp.]|nr:nitroreductase family protein [Rhodoblastus sp.]